MAHGVITVARSIDGHVVPAGMKIMQTTLLVIGLVIQIHSIPEVAVFAERLNMAAIHLETGADLRTHSIVVHAAYAGVQKTPTIALVQAIQLKARTVILEHVLYVAENLLS